MKILDHIREWRCRRLHRLHWKQTASYETERGIWVDYVCARCGGHPHDTYQVIRIGV